MKPMTYIIAIILSMVICFSGATHYKMRCCEVVDINNGVATIIDNKGNTWEWLLEDDEQDVYVGQECRLNMSDNHTEDDRTDDYIRYINWVD